MATRLAIEQRILRFFAARDESLRGLPIPLSLTTNSPDGSSLLASALGRGTVGANAYDGRHIKMTTGGETAERTRVDNAGFADATFDLTVSPALSGSPSSGEQLLLYPRGLTPDITEQAINDVLRLTHGPHLWIPSLASNAAMENASQITTDFPAVGTPSTGPDFATSVSAVGFQIIGVRAVKVIQTGTAGVGFETAAIVVREGEQLVLSTLVSVGGGSIDVILRNATAKGSSPTSASP